MGLRLTPTVDAICFLEQGARGNQFMGDVGGRRAPPVAGRQTDLAPGKHGRWAHTVSVDEGRVHCAARLLMGCQLCWKPHTCGCVASLLYIVFHIWCATWHMKRRRGTPAQLLRVSAGKSRVPLGLT